MWLSGGVSAAVAHVEGGGRGQEAASPQLLLYPQYHLDSASLLARMPLPQVGRWGSLPCAGVVGAVGACSGHMQWARATGVCSWRPASYR